MLWSERGQAFEQIPQVKTGVRLTAPRQRPTVEGEVQGISSESLDNDENCANVASGGSGAEVIGYSVIGLERLGTKAPGHQVPLPTDHRSLITLPRSPIIFPSLMPWCLSARVPDTAHRSPFTLPP